MKTNSLQSEREALCAACEKRCDQWQGRAQDKGAVAKAQRLLDAELPQERAEQTAEMFAAFADPTRLKLLHALAGGEMCVCDLSLLLGVSVSAVSHQLRGLKTLRLVRARREGKMMFYSLDDDHVLSLLAVGLQHASERNSFHANHVSTRVVKPKAKRVSSGAISKPLRIPA